MLCVSAQVKDKSSAVLLSEVTRLVLPGTRIITDALRSYGPLPEFGYDHAVVVHKENFVNKFDDSVHMQNIEIRNRWTKDAIHSYGSDRRLRWHVCEEGSNCL